jgi:ribosomal protein L40E
MGIGVLSPTGTLVTRLRQYVHRCRVCFRCALDRITRAHKQLSVSRDMRAEFCGKCGHNQLDRVTALIDPVDSSVQLCLSRARFNKPPRRVSGAWTSIMQLCVAVPT